MRRSYGKGLMPAVKELSFFVLCSFLFFFACSASRTDDNCRETSKEKVSMKEDRGNVLHNETASYAELATPSGSEAVAFGMG
jgi:hypothetical protein